MGADTWNVYTDPPPHLLPLNTLTNTRVEELKSVWPAFASDCGETAPPQHETARISSQNVPPRRDHTALLFALCAIRWRIAAARRPVPFLSWTLVVPFTAVLSRCCDLRPGDMGGGQLRGLREAGDPPSRHASLSDTLLVNNPSCPPPRFQERRAGSVA